MVFSEAFNGEKVMGKIPPKQEDKPAPVTKESDAVKSAGQRVVDSQKTKTGRSSTYVTNPAMKTGFTGVLNKKTGSV